MGKKKGTAGSSGTASAAKVGLDWSASTISKREENKMRTLGLISSVESDFAHPGSASRPRPPKGFTVMFDAFLYRGLSLPAHEFLRSLLFFYGIQLWLLTPNSILHLSIFIILCEAFLGIYPHWGLWGKISYVKRHNGNDGPPVVGAIGFVVRKEVNYFNYPMKERSGVRAQSYNWISFGTWEFDARHRAGYLSDLDYFDREIAAEEEENDEEDEDANVDEDVDDEDDYAADAERGDNGHDDGGPTWDLETQPPDSKEEAIAMALANSEVDELNELAMWDELAIQLRESALEQVVGVKRVSASFAIATKDKYNGIKRDLKKVKIELELTVLDLLHRYRNRTDTSSLTSTVPEQVHSVPRLPHLIRFTDLVVHGTGYASLMLTSTA
ncbi:hypothetical protein QYE76_055614 [Lolium multiflorum]|uniref:Transposase (putative) gypsy type domain-containing protein n=1 Tax=Lolium multiflorum TaxID=4521 RepID=A0AAD8T1F0_LOLMU|nr:hypothetical protein QYE76_055614 [Lolium multiflorum]